MRTEPDKLKAVVVRLPVDQHEIGPDVAIAAILPLADERMVAKALRQWSVGREDVHRLHEQFIELLAEDAGLLASVVPLKARGVLNRPYSGS
jgi:hypothetical protein